MATGRSAWIERSGSSIDYLEALPEAYPEARFLHPHRDSRETALSVREHHAFRLPISILYGAPLDSGETLEELGPLDLHAPPDDADPISRILASRPPPEYFGRCWSDQILHGFRVMPAIDAVCYREVRFEDLLARPREMLETIAAFFELPKAPGFLERGAALVRGQPPERYPKLDAHEREALGWGGPDAAVTLLLQDFETHFSYDRFVGADETTAEMIRRRAPPIAVVIAVVAVAVWAAGTVVAQADEPAPYTGREPFVAMDPKAPPRSVVRAGAMASVRWPHLAFNAAGVRPGQTVADIGFGMGRITVDLALAVGPSGHVFARDVSDRGMALLGRRMQRAGVSNVDAAVSRPDDVLIPPGQVEVALLADVYPIIVRHQEETKKAFLKSLFRAMKPGGVVVIVNVATGAHWADPDQKFHRATVHDFTRSGFVAGRRAVFADGRPHLREIFEFQRPVATSE